MIVELNLRHFRERLATETDPEKRKTIAGLLAEEEAKLAQLCEGERSDGTKGGTQSPS